MSNSVQSPEIIAETERWFVLLKPAGWLTIPGRGTQAPVLSEWLEREKGKAWTVHRLDVETSGVILFARTAEAHREANAWFQEHKVRKAYDLLAKGELRAPVTRIKEPVASAPSVTQVELKETFASAGCFLARALPLTGRRHQIRIHLASQGAPLLGDPQYGGVKRVALGQGRSLEFGRVALHAARLELPTREVFEAPWPEDFAGWVRELRISTNEGGGTQAFPGRDV